MLGLTAIFVGLAAANLDAYPPMSGDEAWIMSVAYKLTTQGIFGSDLYAGLFNADQHYFIALPVHHVLQAISFEVAGPGVAQARWVSVISGAVVLWVSSWLAYRWYGLIPALLTGLLLVFWKSHWAELRTGVPLLGASRSGRYDMSALAWMWVSIGLLDALLRRPRRGSAFALGICAGLATLTQFFGAFVLPLIAGVWLWRRRERALTGPISFWMLLGIMSILLPYLLYAAYYSTDLIEQTTWFKGDRAQIDSLAFYVANIYTEPARYAGLVRWPEPGSWLLILGAGATLFSIYRRNRQAAMSNDSLLWPSLLVFAGLLALLDRTKAPLYAIVLLPSVCMLVAVSVAEAVAWLWARQNVLARVLVAILSAGLLAVVVRGGVNAQLRDQQQAAPNNPYLDIGQRLNAYLPPHAIVLGGDRWWWALHNHSYLSVHSYFSPWRAYTSYRNVDPLFAAWVAQRRIGFIIVDWDMYGAISEYPEAIRTQISGFLQSCSVAVVKMTDATYGRIDMYKVVPSAARVCRS